MALYYLATKVPSAVFQSLKVTCARMNGVTWVSVFQVFKSADEHGYIGCYLQTGTQCLWKVTFLYLRYQPDKIANDIAALCPCYCLGVLFYLSSGHLKHVGIHHKEGKFACHSAWWRLINSPLQQNREKNAKQLISKTSGRHSDVLRVPCCSSAG